MSDAIKGVPSNEKRLRDSLARLVISAEAMTHDARCLKGHQTAAVPVCECTCGCDFLQRRAAESRDLMDRQAEVSK